MRYLTVLVVLVVLLSCQRENAEGDSPDLAYSVDTVMIDPGDEILFLRRGLFGADISNDGKYLLNFNLDDHTIEKINLDELRLEEKLPFEIEGPDGTGKHVNYINVLKGDSIFIKSFGQSALFQLDGGLVKRIDWVKRYDIDANKSYQNFVLMFGNTFLDPTIHLMSENDFILVSHQFSNEIYVFNLNGEPTKTVTYEPKMTPKRAKDLGGKGIISQTIIKLGIIINDYPNDIPFPSCLMSGYISNRPIHIVIGINQKDCVIITAYEPDPHLWDKDFKIKIK